MVLTMENFPPPLKEGCLKFIPETKFSNEVNHEHLVDKLSRECAALVLDETNNLPTFSWITNENDVKHERGRRAPNGRKNHSSPVYDYGKGVKEFDGSSRGTGVFIPSIETINMKSPMLPMHRIGSIPRKGTGVFLVAPVYKNNTNGENGQNSEKSSATSNELALKKNESSQVASEICLPQEWPY